MGTEPGAAAKRLQPLSGIAAAGPDAAVVAGVESGSLIRVDSTGETTTLATGLSRPSDVLSLGDGMYVVSEMGMGRVVSAGAQGHLSTLLGDLQSPKGLGLYQNTVLVLDAGAQTLYAIDPRTFQRQTLVTNLPIGASGPMDFPGGLAVSAEGTVYLAGDLDGSLLALRQVHKLA